MADAVPVSRRAKPEPAKIAVEVQGEFKTDKERKEAEEAALAFAKQITAESIPEVPDSLVNTLGQEKNYGKIKAVKVIEYEVKDRKGEPTGQMRTYHRVDH